jgi:hypothetical protein
MNVISLAVLMMQYLILLTITFIIQFSVSIAVLAFNKNEQAAIIEVCRAMVLCCMWWCGHVGGAHGGGARG